MFWIAAVEAGFQFENSPHVVKIGPKGYLRALVDNVVRMAQSSTATEQQKKKNDENGLTAKKSVELKKEVWSCLEVAFGPRNLKEKKNEQLLESIKCPRSMGNAQNESAIWIELKNSQLTENRLNFWYSLVS